MIQNKKNYINNNYKINNYLISPSEITFSTLLDNNFKFTYAIKNISKNSSTAGSKMVAAY